MMPWRRAERLVRSQVFALPFAVARSFTRFDIEGREHLEHAISESRRTGRGLITISNHLSMFDDPFVLMALCGQRALNVETKRWWSTPCESNFSPRGRGPRARLVRAFSDVSKMVFFARPRRKIIEVPESYTEALARRGATELLRRLEVPAALAGSSVEAFLRGLVTPGDSAELAALNQAGMLEACAHVACGDWLHFFPEGGRSRDLELMTPKRGVGKVLYHGGDAIVLPFCFYGTQDVMPVNARLPRPFKRVVATIGPPLAAAELRELRAEAPRSEVYEALIDRAWQSVVALRGPTLARYLGKPPPAPEPVARSADDAAYLGLGSAWVRANWADTENSVPHGVASGPAPAGSQAVASGPAPAGPPDRLA